MDLKEILNSLPALPGWFGWLHIRQPRHEEGYASEVGNSYVLFLSRKDYALTEEEALEKFEEMRQRKIASLERSLKKIKEATPKILSK